MASPKSAPKTSIPETPDFTGSGTVVAYLRVSTADQTLEPQRLALQPWSPTREFSDVMSGSKAERPGLDSMMDWVREGDTVLVYSLSRLGRSTTDLLSLLDRLSEKRVRVVSATESIDTSTPSGRLVVTILAAVAQMEREQLVERTHAGLAAARRAGRVGGRPRALTPEEVEEIREARESGVTIGALCRRYDVGRSTIYRALGKPAGATLGATSPSPSSETARSVSPERSARS